MHDVPGHLTEHGHLRTVFFTNDGFLEDGGFGVTGMAQGEDEVLQSGVEPWIQDIGTKRGINCDRICLEAFKSGHDLHLTGIADVAVLTVQDGRQTGALLDKAKQICQFILGADGRPERQVRLKTAAELGRRFNDRLAEFQQTSRCGRNALGKLPAVQIQPNT
ncbi:MAG: hypothetical protein A3A24_01855 [Candidatus Buchananbacteria bacterium RIFCSPLOWO2_01_FULL_46_12]|uniref:Uncharacterized protein n=2 Tax=Candidatus Buchananiibacteriota TaxID=1817903 RepID=A0A1G1YN00_9BACT|nr:MAG: hypothetical protein A2744_00455 [Candidatus Buchananbacteria bacterium RIFCSPHIGHO2_01_FULL_44_11]OGY53664.1 MAG: hypothetical protein A3A24_01855 [Candidatus Buchananbacteria bacterium RIFCSPLOWO2_01_FULL_46_12]